MSSERKKEIILEMHDIIFSYEEHKPFIKGLSLSIANGEFVGLLGANGSGKSTVLKIASGILKPLQGTVRLWGKPLNTYKNRDRAKLICYLPQLLDMHIPFKVRELVTMGLYPYDIQPRTTVQEALEQVGLTSKAESYIGDLSGGERRRAFIAMTLLQGAGLLLLDEPFANLDFRYQSEILKLLKDLKSAGNISIFMALHDINTVTQCEKIILMKQGHILDSGKPESMLKKDILRAAFDIDISMIKDSSGKLHVHYGLDSPN